MRDSPAQRVGGRRRTPAAVTAVLPGGSAFQRAGRASAEIRGRRGQPAAAGVPLAAAAGGRGTGGRRTAERRGTAPAQRARPHPAAVQTAADATGECERASEENYSFKTVQNLRPDIVVRTAWGHGYVFYFFLFRQNVGARYEKNKNANNEYSQIIT